MNSYQDPWEKHDTKFYIPSETLKYLISLLEDSIETGDHVLLERAISILEELEDDESYNQSEEY